MVLRFSAGGFSLAAALLLSLAPGGVDAFVAPTSSTTTASSTALFAKGPRTLYDKIWDDHVVTEDDSSSLIYIDRHLVHEVSYLLVIIAGCWAVGRRAASCVIISIRWTRQRSG